MNKELKDKLETTMYKGEDTRGLEEEIGRLKENMKKTKIEIERKEQSIRSLKGKIE